MTVQLYYRTITPQTLGVYAERSWKNSKRINRHVLMSRIDGRRGTLKKVYEYLSSLDCEEVNVSAKWYGGAWSRYKVEIKAN